MTSFSSPLPRHLCLFWEPLSSPSFLLASVSVWLGWAAQTMLPHLREKHTETVNTNTQKIQCDFFILFYFNFLNLNGGTQASVASINNKAARTNFEVESWPWRSAGQLFLASLNWWDTLVTQKCSSCGAAVNKPALRWFVLCNDVKLLDFSQWSFQKHLSFSGVSCWSIVRTVWVFISNKLVVFSICVTALITNTHKGKHAVNTVFLYFHHSRTELNSFGLQREARQLYNHWPLNFLLSKR